MLVAPVLIVACALTFLAHTTGTRSANDLANQNMQQIHKRIEEQLTRLLEMPPALNVVLKRMLAMGELSLTDVDHNRAPVFEMLHIFQAVSSVVIGAGSGETMWVIRYPGETTYEYAMKRSPETKMEEYALDEEGRRVGRRLSQYDFHPTLRPWYQAAIAADGPTWGDVYVWIRGGKGETLGVPYVEPYRDAAGNILGVINCELSLADISAFLGELEIGRTGKAFIIEGDGSLIATSEGLECMTADLAHLSATQAPDPWIAAASRALLRRFSSPGTIMAQQRATIEVAGQPMRMVVSPYHNRRNLDWLIVTLVPDADFLAAIQRSRAHSALLGGLAVALMLAVSMITAMKLIRAQERVKQQRDMLETTLESLTYPFYVIDASNYSIVLMNSAAQRLASSGCATCYALTHGRDAPCDGQDHPCPLELVKKSGKPALVEHTHYDAEGRRTFVEVHGYPVFDDAGNLVQMIEYSLDISERRQTQAQLQKLSSAVEQSPSSVVITDVTGCIEYVNPKFTALTGYTLEEARGQNPRMLKSGRQPPEFYEDLWKTITAGREWRGEFCNRKKNGDLYWEAASISPIRDADGKPKHFVAVKEDVTERKRAEQALIEARQAAEAATKAKSNFLANMSHEIRTPMNGIIGMTDLALDTQLTPEQRDYLNTVKSSADALLTLINDILDFSKIEAGKLELEPINFALRDALADMLNTLANRAHSKGLELVYEVLPDVHDALIGDVYRVRQVIVNLVGNAIKFTDRGEIAAGVEQVERTDQDTTLHFWVRDTGIGIPPDKLEAVFEPFEQADASTTRQFGGTGLGLAISVQLVELMGGRIWAESRVGEGSTFHFTAVFGLGKAAPTPDAQKRRELLHGVPVLVVDDNATNRRILDQMLRNWQMAPQSVADGAAALAALDRAANAGKPFRLVLSDVNMPEMDGFTVFERARSNPQHQGTPFILLTSAARPSDIARCREMGVAAHLIKPIKQSLLMNVIAGAVAGKDAVALAPERPREATGTTTSNRVLHILLAEDNAVNQKFAVRTIEKAGHAVFVANNGREAVEAWERDRYDVVLMDMQMPEMDGVEATSRIRSLERERGMTPRTPIIAMTANAMKGDKERCLGAGMDGYVSKPVNRQTLFAEIERVLETQ